MFTGSSSVVQIKRCVRDRVFAVIPAATGRGTYLTRDINMFKNKIDKYLVKEGYT